VIVISGRDSNWVATCLLLKLVAPYLGRSIGFHFGDVDHSNGGGWLLVNEIPNRPHHPTIATRRADHYNPEPL
jgi:hypothetical protein